MTYLPGQEPFKGCNTKWRRLLLLARAVKAAQKAEQQKAEQQKR